MAVLRYRQIVEHLSPKSRTITDEFTISNKTGDDLNSLLFEFPGVVYRANLHVYDSDGTELSFYPNHHAKIYLESQSEPWARELLNEMKEKKKSVLIIDLPSTTPLKKNETRVVRLVYTDMQEPQVPYRNLLSIPRFTFKLLPPVEKGYRTQVVVLPPTDFELRLKSMVAKQKLGGKETDITESEDVHKTKSKAVLDFSLPTRDTEVEFKGEYEILPDKEEKWLFKLYCWGIIISSILIFSIVSAAPFISVKVQALHNSFFLNVVQTLDPLVDTMTRNRVALGDALLILVVGFLGLVTNPLTHRTKLWMLLPLLVSILIIVLNP